MPMTRLPEKKMPDDISTQSESTETTETVEAKESKGSKVTQNESSDDLPTTKTGKTITPEYVNTLREEAKSHRLKAKEAEDRVKALEKEKADLANQSIERIEKMNNAFENRIINAELVIAADKEGLKDKDAFKMCDLSSVKVSENGEVTGVKELISELKAKKPYLFEKVSNTNTQVGDVETEATHTKERPVYKDKAEFKKAQDTYIASLKRQ